MSEQELPSFRPTFRLDKKESTDPYPEHFPYIEDDRIYTGMTFAQHGFTNAHVQEWKEGRGLGPTVWWLKYIKAGWHPNIEEVRRICGENTPEDVEVMYHPVTQLRIALEQPVSEKTMQAARFGWSFFWFQKTGVYKQMPVNYTH